MDKDEVIALMRSSKSEREWNDNCTKVKTACGGYPSWWFATIVSSGLAGEVAASFGADADIHIMPISAE